MVLTIVYNKLWTERIETDNEHNIVKYDTYVCINLYLYGYVGLHVL